MNAILQSPEAALQGQMEGRIHDVGLGISLVYTPFTVNDYIHKLNILLFKPGMGYFSPRKNALNSSKTEEIVKNLRGFPNWKTAHW